MLYDRLRIMAFDGVRPFLRGDEEAVRRIHDLIGKFGCDWRGWQGHSYQGTNPTHLFMVDQPTEAQINDLLIFSSTSEKVHGVRLKILREFIGQDTVEL